MLRSALALKFGKPIKGPLRSWEGKVAKEGDQVRGIRCFLELTEIIIAGVT